jgi:hypothetical protein
MTKITGKDVEKALESDAALVKKGERAGNKEILAAYAAGKIKLTPQRVAQLRSRIANIIAVNMDTAFDVIEGTKTWTPTQARIFQALLNKVVPDIKASVHQHNHVHTDASKLSREELMRIASEGAMEDEESEDVVDADYKEVEPT